MNTHYDDRPPCYKHAAGYWVDRAWQDVLDERRWAANAQTSKKFDFFKPSHVHRRYGPKDICSVCHAQSPSLNGKCSRCYHREYARAYYQKKQSKIAEAHAVTS